MQQVDVMRRGKIAWQPGQQKIETVVVRGEAQHESPNLALPKQVGEGRALGGFGAVFRLRSAASDVLALGIRENLVFAGVAIERVKQREEQNADDAGGRKIPAPSEMQEPQAQHRSPHRA